MTISAGARRQLDALLAAQPEAAPWLGLLSAVLDACGDAAWDVAASETRLQPERAPRTALLAGAEIPVDARHADRWLRRVLELASNAGPDAASLRAASRTPDLDTLHLLEAAIDEDEDRLTAAALSLQASPEALSVALGLAVMPLLQALHHRFGGAADPRWGEGFCPVCGAWPLLAELRGLERVRRLRCGRCGGDWAQAGVRCPYCDATGHGSRAALVPEPDGEARKVETCTRCLGYLKSVSTLRAWDAGEIPLADLATVDLDLAAIEREFTRPAPRGLSPGARVVDRGDRRTIGG